MSTAPAPRLLRPHEFGITSVIQEVALPFTASCRLAYLCNRDRHLLTLWEGRDDRWAVRRFIVREVSALKPDDADKFLAEDLIIRWVAPSNRWGFIILCEIDEYRRAQTNEDRD